MTPLDLEREFGLTQGNIFQGELSLEQLFFLRPVPGWAYYKTPIENLYMCGSATHPGGGIMAAPGRIASQVILKEWKGGSVGQEPFFASTAPAAAAGGELTMPLGQKVVIIGGGHNGLITAFYLAKGGFKPVVLEAPRDGGRRRGHRRVSSGISRLDAGAHARAAARGRGARPGRGKIRLPDSSSPTRACFRLRWTAEDCCFIPTRRRPRAASRGSPRKTPRSTRNLPTALEEVAGVFAQLSSITPPAIDKPTPEDLWNLFKTGRGVRGLGKKGIFDLLRWGPMAVADFVAEFFETELIRATIAARGIFGTALGPWSAGSTAVLLMRAAADANPVGSAAFARGGLGEFFACAGGSGKAGGRGNSYRCGSAADSHQGWSGRRSGAARRRRDCGGSGGFGR